MEIDAFMLVSNFGRFAAAVVVVVLVFAAFLAPPYLEARKERQRQQNWYKSDKKEIGK